MRTELDVVNSCLAVMGQSPVTSLVRPTRHATMALELLRKYTLKLQSTSWWFNSFVRELTPDAGAAFSVLAQLPAGLVSLRALEGAPRLLLKAPGVLEYADGRVVEAPVKAHLTVAYPFADLPPMVQLAVEDIVIRAFAARAEGDPQAAVDADRDLAQAVVQLNAEHIRQMGANMLNNQDVQAQLFFARGPRPSLRYRS